METIKKNYKPEILICPKCNKKLVYAYASSAKLITFTQGRQYFVKNLAYKCPCCDHLYVSQTATKFAFKGIRYSAKVCFMIYYYKKSAYSRERICDMLSLNNIFISDRNIDNIYNLFKHYLSIDYLAIIDKEYQETLNEYHDLKISIDLISYNKNRLIIIRNYFTSKIIGFYHFESIDDPQIKQILSAYINEKYNISTIISIRKDDIFIPLLKKLAGPKTKFLSYLKI